MKRNCTEALHVELDPASCPNYGTKDDIPDLNTEILDKFRQNNLELISELQSHTSTAIIAGHYCLAEHMQELSHTGEAEVMCFYFGVQLYKQAVQAGKTCYLVVWINDIGISEEEREAIKHGFILPENYLQILAAYGLDQSHVTIMFEGSMRNKASTLVKKISKREPGRLTKVAADRSDLVRCVQSSSCDISEAKKPLHAYVIEGPNGEKLVVKEGPAPKCNLILATFFRELASMFSPKHFINVFNDVYAYRLQLGIHVAHNLLGNPVPMTNILCDGYNIRSEQFVNTNQ